MSLHVYLQRVGIFPAKLRRRRTLRTHGLLSALVVTAMDHTGPMIGVYAGRFDPATNGHLDIIRRATRLFDALVVAVYDLPPDRSMFSTEDRITMLRASLEDSDVEVEPFHGLLTEFVRQRGAGAIVRGLRAVTDFSVEFDQALMYKDMAPEIEQVYLMSDLRHIFLSASRVREVATLGHDVSRFVPPAVAEALQKHLRSE